MTRLGGTAVRRSNETLGISPSSIRLLRRQRQTESLATMRALTCIKAVEPTVSPSCHSVSAIREWPMDDTLKSKILELQDQHRLMTVATNKAGRLAASNHRWIGERRPDALFPVRPAKPKGGEPRAG